MLPNFLALLSGQDYTYSLTANETEPVEPTSKSLLQRLRQPGNDPAWERFVRLYTPLLYFWANRCGCPRGEADDLVQDIFATLLEKMPAFAYDPERSFRAWLRTVAVNKWRARQRRRQIRPGPLADDQVPASNEDDPAEWLAEEEYRVLLLRRSLEIMKTDFTEQSWQAGWQVLVEGKSAAKAAAALGTTVGAVHAAKFRILSRLRAELAGLMD